MLKTNENMHPQSRETYRQLYGGGGGGGGKFVRPTIQTSVKFCDFAGPYLRSLSLSYLASLLI